MKNSVDTEMENIKKNLGTGFILEADINNEVYYKAADISYGSLVYSGAKITQKLIEQILEVPGVTEYSIESLLDLVYTDLNLRPGGWSDRMHSPHKNFPLKDVEIWMHSTWVRPCAEGKLHTNFRTGALEITEGRNIQKSDKFKAVISEYLAKENQLSVGDTFTVETKEGNHCSSDTPAKTWGDPVELEVVGVFHMNFTQPSSEYTHEDGYMENNIYTDLHTHEVLSENLTVMFPREEDHTKVIFFVEDPEKMEEVMQQVAAIEEVNADGLLLSIDDTAYQASSKPYGQIRAFAVTLLMVGLVGIGIILYLVMKLWVQSRMHEAGILLSLGVGKRKIIGQMLVENLMVAAAALMLSLLLSGIMVDKCMNIAEQVTKPKGGEEAYKVELSYTNELIVNQVSAKKVELEHDISGYEMVLTVVLVCGVSSLSVLLAAIKITDIEPKRLLRSM